MATVIFPSVFSLQRKLQTVGPPRWCGFNYMGGRRLASSLLIGWWSYLLQSYWTIRYQSVKPRTMSFAVTAHNSYLALTDFPRLNSCFKYKIFLLLKSKIDSYSYVFKTRLKIEAVVVHRLMFRLVAHVFKGPYLLMLQPLRFC